MLPSEEYVESGYFLASDYVGGVADAVGILGGYFVEGADYVETGYLLDQTVQFTIVINTDGTVQLASATLASAVSFLATVSRIRPADVTLNNIANLNAQAAITRTTDSNLSAAFDIGHDDGGFQNNVQPSVTFDSSSTQNSTATLTTDALLVKFGDATLNSTTSLTSTPIEYKTRRETATPGSRPHYPSTIDNTSINTSNYALGDGSLLVDIRSNDAINDWLEYTLADDDVTKPTSGSGTAMAIEFFVKNQTWIETWTSNRSSDPDNTNKGWVFSTTTTQARFYGTEDTGDSNPDNLLVGSYAGTDGDFHHIAIRIDGPSSGSQTWSMWVDGSRVDTYTGFLEIDNSTDTMYLAFGRNENYSSQSDLGGSFIDEFRILKGTPSELDSALGYSHSDTSFTVPTSKYTNNLNTRILLHFDTDYSYYDDDVGIHLFDATIDSNATVTASVSGIVQGSAVLDTNAGFAVVANATKVGETVLDAVATTTVVNDRIRAADSTVNSAAGITTTAQRTRSTAATLDTNGGFAVTAQLTASGETVLSSAFSTSSEGTVTRTDSAVLDSQFGQTVDVVRNRFGTAELDSSTTVTAQALITRNSSANFSSTFSINCVPSATKPSSATISALYSTLTVAAKIGDFLVSADSNFSISMSGTVTRTDSAELAAVATLAPVAGAATRSGSGDLVAEGTLTSSGRLTAAATATVNSNSTMSASGDRIRSSSTVQLGEFGATLTPTKISPFAIDMESAFAASIAPTYIRGASAELLSVASITPNAGVLYEGAAELTGFAAVVSVNKVLHLDQYVYVIPSENRTYTIPAETREYSITAEDRTLVIEGS